MSADVYSECPVYENELVTLRLIERGDAEGLLKCYCDPYAAPLFNSDNCGGDFRMTTLEQVTQAIDAWLRCYESSDFVRFTIVDHALQEAVGTVEMFHRRADDALDHAGVLRLDIRSELETRGYLYEVLSLCLKHFYADFSTDRILTKAIPLAVERRAALEALGFTPSKDGLMGYPHYFIRHQ